MLYEEIKKSLRFKREKINNLPSVGKRHSAKKQPLPSAGKRHSAKKKPLPSAGKRHSAKNDLPSAMYLPSAWHSTEVALPSAGSLPSDFCLARVLEKKHSAKRAALGKGWVSGSECVVHPCSI